MFKYLIITTTLILLSPLAFGEKLVFINSSKSEFSHPHDLTLGVNKQYLFVADMNHDLIKVLDPKSLKTVASIGKEQLSSPHDVTFDNHGQMLVADSGNDRIAIYSLNNLTGNLVAELNKNMLSPEGVSSDDNGNIYVANAGNNLIQKFQNGKLVKSTGGFGSTLGKFNRAHDLEYFQGKIYIGDPGNNRVQVLDTSLIPRQSIHVPNKPFNEPKYLSIGNNGKLYVADQHNNSLRIFNSQGDEIYQLSSANGQTFDRIEGVEVDDAYVWISDTYNDRVVLFQWQ